MTMKDQSYLGSGKVLAREYGVPGPFIDVGNCSALNFSPQTNAITLADHTQPGGGERNRVDRLTGVEMSYTFHDFAPENLARALRGTVTNVIAGNAVDEAVVGYKGGLVPLLRIAKEITSVKPATGSTNYTAGTDYVLQDGALFIPADSAIVDPVGGVANLKVTYAFGAQSVLQPVVTAAKQYQLLFLGLNEAQSGKAVRIMAHRVSGGVMAQFSAIGDEHGAGEVTGALMTDSSKGAGLSRYFEVVQEVIA